MKFKTLILLLIILTGCSTALTYDTKDYDKYQDYDVNIQFPIFNKVEGDCSLIKFDNGKIMLVDCFDKSADLIIQYLKEQDIKKIDYILISHFHDDHVGMFPAIAENFDIDIILSTKGYTKDAEEYLKTVERFNLREVELKKGDDFNIGNCNIKVLWPDLSNETRYDLMYNPGSDESLINNSSLVFKLTFNKFSILYTGDIYKSVDKKLIYEYGDELKSTVLKVAHHGDYYTANSTEFIEAVKPVCAIIQDSRYVNRFYSTTKSRFRNSGIPLLWLNDNGVIDIKIKGNSYCISEE